MNVRRGISLFTAALAGAIVLSGIASWTTAEAITVGEVVRTTANLGVRATPVLSSPLLARQSAGNRGTVLEGPVAADGYAWWRVDYDRAPDGWSAGAYLALVSGGGQATLTLAANPATITLGQSSTLTWESTGASSCIASGEWTGSKPLSGSQTVTPATVGQKNYSLACGTAVRSVALTVAPGGGGTTAPSITTQPQSQTVPAGQTATFSVVAAGTQPLLYQWRKGSTAVGTNSATLSLPNVQQSNAGTYTVAVSNAQGSVTSTPATLTVSSSTPGGGIGIGSAVKTVSSLGVRSTPSISGTLLGRQTTGARGTVLDGPVSANGYTWWKIDYVNAPDGWSAGEYLVLAAGGGGTTAPSITLEPQSQTVPAGQTATFSCQASGNPTPTYRWQKAAPGTTFTDLSPAVTTPTLTLVDLGLSRNGEQFRCIATNSAGSATSNAATLTVTSGSGQVVPSITTQPQSQTVPAGQTATFSVVAAGTPSLSYQWRKGSTAVGTNSATLSLPNVQQSNAGTYTVAVSNAQGSVTSSAATLTVNSVTPSPSITSQPQNVTASVGSTATFSVIASGVSPLSYQWQKNGMNISGATNNALILNNIQNSSAGAYRVTVTNSFGSVTSNEATLMIGQAGTLQWNSAYINDYDIKNSLNGYMNMDWDNKITHYITFIAFPQLSPPYLHTSQDMTDAQHIAWTTQVHAHGAKALLSWGLADAQVAVMKQLFTSQPATQNVMGVILAQLRSWGYDGIDWDLESQNSKLTPDQYRWAVEAVRAILDTWSPHGYQTQAGGWEPFDFPASLINANLDQYNLMTYDGNGWWTDGTGFHLPLHNPAPNWPAFYPTSFNRFIDYAVDRHVAYGIPLSKIGIGLGYYGWGWSGPKWTGPGIRKLPGDQVSPSYFIFYNDIVTHYLNHLTPGKDNLAHSSWVHNPSGQGYSYINYDDPTDIADKVNWAKQRGVGGLMAFTLGNTYIASNPAGHRFPLAEAVKNNW